MADELVDLFGEVAEAIPEGPSTRGWRLPDFRGIECPEVGLRVMKDKANSAKECREEESLIIEEHLFVKKDMKTTGHGGLGGPVKGEGASILKFGGI